jgi:hypothetical protein
VRAAEVGPILLYRWEVKPPLERGSELPILSGNHCVYEVTEVPVGTGRRVGCGTKC